MFKSQLAHSYWVDLTRWKHCDYDPFLWSFWLGGKTMPYTNHMFKFFFFLKSQIISRSLARWGPRHDTQYCQIKILIKKKRCSDGLLSDKTGNEEIGNDNIIRISNKSSNEGIYKSVCAYLCASICAGLLERERTYVHFSPYRNSSVINTDYERFRYTYLSKSDFVVFWIWDWPLSMLTNQNFKRLKDLLHYQ